MLNFISPLFIWSIGILIVPVIIHLIHFKRFKKVYFPSIQFLKNIQVVSKKQRELKKWLILATRVLFFSSIVLAFAQPFLPGKNKIVNKELSIICIYIDNSFSMMAEGREGSLLQEAKKKAIDLVKSRPESDRFHLLTNSFEGKFQRIISKEECLDWINEIKPSHYFRTLNEIEGKQNSVLGNSDNNKALRYIFSDFQKAIVNNYKESSNLYPASWIWVGTPTRSNISLDTCFFLNPYIKLNEPCTLKVRVTNYGSDNIENSSLTLKIDGKQKSLGSFSASGGESVECTLSFFPEKTGWQNASVEIADYPVSFDDKLFFSFQVQSKTNIYIIAPKSVNLAADQVFLTDPFFSLKHVSEGEVNYNQLRQSHLVVLNSVEEMSTGMIEELNEFIKKGGSAIWFPSELTKNNIHASVISWLKSFGITIYYSTNQKEIKMEEINLSSPLFTGVFDKIPKNINLPILKKYINIKLNRPDYDWLLKDGYGNSHVILLKPGKGRLTLFSSSTSKESGNLSRHPLFVPILIKTAFLAQPISQLYFNMEQNVGIPFPGEWGLNEYPPQLIYNNIEIIPEIRSQQGESVIFTDDQIQEPGIYQLKELSKKEIPYIAFNYSRLESNPDCYSVDDLKDRAGNNRVTISSETDGKKLAELDDSKPFWKYLIVFSILLLLFEIFLLIYQPTSTALKT